MGEFQGTQLHQLLQSLESVSAKDTLHKVAQELSIEPVALHANLTDTISVGHPYIDQVSQQLIEIMTPQLKGLMLVACQQALEKGHQAAIVQHQADEDEAIKALEEQIKSLQKINTDLEAQSRVEHENAQHTQDELDSLKEQLLELEAVKAQFDALQVSTQEQAQAQQDLHNQLEEKTTLQQKLSEQLQQSELALAKQKELNALQSNKVKQLIEERSQENASLDDRLKQQERHYQKELADIKTALVDMEGELEQSQQAVAEQQKISANHVKKIQDYQEQLQDKTELLSHIEHASESSLQQLDALSKEKDALAKQLENEQQSLSSLKAQFEQANTRFKQIESNNETLQASLDAKEQELSTLQNSVASLEEAHSALTQEYDNLVQINNEFKDKAEEQAKKHDGRFNDLKKDLFAESKLLKAELEQALANIVTLEQSREQLSEQLSELRVKEKGYQDAIAEKESLLANQDSALNMAQGRNSSLVSRLEAESQQARSAYESIRTQNNELTEKIEELEGKVTEFRLKFEYAQQQLIS